VLVSSYQTSGSELPTDSASLSFAKISYSITPQDPSGAAGPTVTGTWDVRRNSTR
jgi:type VI protein secretion system component Hcp